MKQTNGWPMFLRPEWAVSIRLFSGRFIDTGEEEVGFLVRDTAKENKTDMEGMIEY
jgi:hypothetical protein